ncbi:MAG: 2-polyprenyl-3-methyl-6-methoxy-1,4-benzoquinone monooxygenase [Pseudomonadota bacterium]
MRSHLTLADRLLVLGDRFLRQVAGPTAADATTTPTASGRPVPQGEPADPQFELSAREHELAIRLMRVNHAGEVAAQALYQGQAATARDPQIRAHMVAAGEEERDHLEWCEVRLQELGGATSALAPLWYLGSLAIGATAGASGDRWSLGFVAETERQVEEHLSEHLARLPAGDARSRAILEQMQADEVRHGAEAMAAGGSELPGPVRGVMRQVAKVMTRAAYWI